MSAWFERFVRSRYGLAGESALGAALGIFTTRLRTFRFACAFSCFTGCVKIFVVCLEKQHFPTQKLNTPGRTRTCDRRIRNPVLYPTELLALGAAAL